MDWHTFLIIMHVIGTALGVGGASISDFLFFKSIKDGRVDAKEFDFMKTLSSIIWLGLGILVFSGFGLLILYRLEAQYAGSILDARLLAKFSIALIILLNGLVMHAKVIPLLKSSLNKPLITPQFIKKAPVVFSTGAISIISWYSALILGAWRGLTLPYALILGIYILIIGLGIIFANIIGAYLIKYLRKK